MTLSGIERDFLNRVSFAGLDKPAALRSSLVGSPGGPGILRGGARRWTPSITRLRTPAALR